MVFLINCSNLKTGGGLQVAQSICSQLDRFKQHRFIAILSSYISKVDIADDGNIKVYRYDIKNNLSTLLFGRDTFLDRLVDKQQVDAVLTIFGPSRWRPRCKHLCGFARAQLLLENPLKEELSWKEKLTYRVWKWGFKRSSEIFYTENQYISGMLPHLLGNVKVFTVTNYYNQIFDQPKCWTRNISLPCFNGTTLLTIATPAPHKHLKIMVPMSEYLERTHPTFKFRFILTCHPSDLDVPHHLRQHFVFIGKIDITECPNLYEQADIMFMPTLLECFTATYPEAMRMDVPIVTTNLEFAHGLCGNAACYYDALSAESAAEAIIRTVQDVNYTALLVAAGHEQLKKFDNYEQRANKLIELLEKISTT